MAEIDEVPVLVVGAGPVGLALAGDLGWRGINCLLIEQSDGSIYQPRMDMVGVRTMEFCRRWGIVAEVESSPYPRDYPQDNVYLTAMNGHELGRECFPAMADASPPQQSPQMRERCPQNMFDPILRRFAERQESVTLAYRTRLVGLDPSADGVVASVHDLQSDTVRHVRARYVVGCDGANSFVRRSVGIKMVGNPALTYTTNVIFRCAGLNALHDKAPAYRHIFIGPEGTWATIVAIDGRDHWRMSIIGDRREQALSEGEVRMAIRRAVGVEFDYEIVSIMPWTRRELVAERLCAGRVFILGDAAHVMSPTGGFGMNTGIADAVDLSWKLAACLEGWGADDLPSTLDPERRPVAHRNVAEASRNLARMLSPGPNPRLLDDTPEGEALRSRVGAEFSEAMNHEWYTLGMHLGFRYENSPVCWPDGSAAPADNARDYVQTAHPGARAPHAWLSDGRSTLDLFGTGFVLLCLGDDAAPLPFLEAAAGACGFPLAVHAITETAVTRVYGVKYVLVRPDGHVAWRGDAPPADPEALIDCVRGARLRAWEGRATPQGQQKASEMEGQRL